MSWLRSVVGVVVSMICFWGALPELGEWQRLMLVLGVIAVVWALNPELKS